MIELENLGPLALSAGDRSSLLKSAVASLSGGLERLGNLGIVCFGLRARLISTLDLKELLLTLALKTDRGNQALDFWCLVHDLSWFHLITDLLVRTLDLSANDILANIIIITEHEELADLRGTLGTKATALRIVSEAFQFCISLLHNCKMKHSDVGCNDAAANGFALALSAFALAVACGSLSQEKADTVISEDTLLHGKSLSIVSTIDAEHVAGKFRAKDFSIELTAHSEVHQSTDF